MAARAPAAITGLPGAMVINAPIVAAFVASKPELMTWRPGRSFGFDDILPASFMKATMDPVKVIPPILVLIEMLAKVLKERAYQ